MTKPYKLFAALVCLAAAIAALGQGPMQKTKRATVDKAALAKYEKAYEAAKRQLQKSPKSVKAKQDVTDFGDGYAMATMDATFLPPRVMYPQALKIFREVLKVNPKDPVAKKWIDQIVSIYKSMGRPVPPG